MRIWRGTKEREKEFIKLFESLNPSLSGWQIWENVISAIACSLSNVAEPNNKRRERREKEYERAISQLGGKVEAVAKLMAILVDQLEEYPEEDFLGEMYMNLNMGNHWTGQFFTPTNVAEMMAYINITDGIKAELKEKGYLSVSDPSCGAGVNLLAAAKAFR
ncbi:MAG: SAM-dependent DNA methyltransferase, partial [Lachnospiraceae bacterium]|nr:SAM-dependent DNA methyltransferase [Lachnospiraceae bacterium]